MTLLDLINNVRELLINILIINIFNKMDYNLATMIKEFALLSKELTGLNKSANKIRKSKKKIQKNIIQTLHKKKIDPNNVNIGSQYTLSIKQRLNNDGTINEYLTIKKKKKKIKYSSPF